MQKIKIFTIPPLLNARQIRKWVSGHQEKRSCLGTFALLSWSPDIHYL